VWSAFAATALLAHRALKALVGDAVRPAIVLGAVLVAAGLVQFSPVKHACLRACRSPWTFLWRYYARGIRGGWWLGVRHGLHCLGCCWALMLVMVATGSADLLWMLALAAAMTVEKTAPWGARLVGPLGVALVLAGVTVAVVPVGGGGAPGAVALLLTVVLLAIVGSVREAAGRRRNRRSEGTEARNEDRAPPMQARGCRAEAGQ
jgi:predicted metal-binding membrane protein